MVNWVSGWAIKRLLCFVIEHKQNQKLWSNKGTFLELSGQLYSHHCSSSFTLARSQSSMQNLPQLYLNFTSLQNWTTSRHFALFCSILLSILYLSCSYYSHFNVTILLLSVHCNFRLLFTLYECFLWLCWHFRYFIFKIKMWNIFFPGPYFEWLIKIATNLNSNHIEHLYCDTFFSPNWGYPNVLLMTPTVESCQGSSCHTWGTQETWEGWMRTCWVTGCMDSEGWWQVDTGTHSHQPGKVMVMSLTYWSIHHVENMHHPWERKKETKPRQTWSKWTKEANKPWTAAAMASQHWCSPNKEW